MSMLPADVPAVLLDVPAELLPAVLLDVPAELLPAVLLDVPAELLPPLDEVPAPPSLGLSPPPEQPAKCSAEAAQNTTPKILRERCVRVIES
jgi:hypothetical protein